jgi:type I restriction enzyme S subunit
MNCTKNQEYRLSNLCSYSNLKIKTNDILLKDYITTDSMLSDIKGLKKANNLPNINSVKAFSKEEILLSNVRPYFKKIWFSTKSGGCSSDVLVIRNDHPEIVNNKFLYYLLCTDKFFKYIMSGAKGTKMPRGDKKQIMNYMFFLPPIKKQIRIAGLLDQLDQKIFINDKINDNLSNILKESYKAKFINLESLKSKTQINSHDIPIGWEKFKLSDVCNRVNGYSYTSKELTKSTTGLVSIKNFNRNNTGYNSSNIKDIDPVKPKELQKLELFDVIIACTDLTQNADIIGNGEMITDKGEYDQLILSTDLVKLVPKINYINNYFLACIVNSLNFKGYCKGFINGTTVLHLDKSAIDTYQINLPINIELIINFSNFAKKVYQMISVNNYESRKIEKMKRLLLVKLFNN